MNVLFGRCINNLSQRFYINLVVFRAHHDFSSSSLNNLGLPAQAYWMSLLTNAFSGLAEVV